jgi:hypothetical protein
MCGTERATLEHTMAFTGGADLPVYLRVTQADGHQAWSSPIYLIARTRPRHRRLPATVHLWNTLPFKPGFSPMLPPQPN